MDLSIVLFFLLHIFQVQCEGWYQQQPRRRYSHLLRPLKNNRHYNTESYHQQSPYKLHQNTIPHRTDPFAQQSSSNHYPYQINHNIKPSTTVSFSHYIPYKYYGYQPHQIYKIYKTESFGSHSILPRPINTFNLNDHPINGQYKCQVCYKCYEDTSSEESFESFEDSWSRTDIVVLYRHNNKIYKVGQENGCPYTFDLCCCKISPPPVISFLPRPFRPSWSTQTPISNILPQSRPQRPGLISPQHQPPKSPSWKPSSQTPRPSIYPQTPRPSMIYPQTPRPSMIYPQTPRPSMIYPQTPFWTLSLHPPNSSYIPPMAPSWKPSPPSQYPRPPMIYPHTPIYNQSPKPPTPSYLPPKDPARTPPHQPEPLRPSEVDPSPTANCTCTPFFRCYDEETSSNLTGAVDDRDHNTVRQQERCPSPNDVCCYNPVKSLSVPTSSNPSPQPQPPNPTPIVPSPDANCTCTPFFRCYDEETSSNLTGDVNDRNHISERQESCPSPNDVCCFNLVTAAVVPQTISPFIPSETEDPASCTCTPFFRCYDEETSSNLTDAVDDRHQESCPDSNDVCCYNLVQATQAPPPQTSLYPIDECTCTPFFRCYDEETSSNLTGTVDDRNEVQTKQESCPNPNDVCCYNLVEISPTYSPGILAKSLSLQHDPLSPSLLEGSSKTTDRHHGSSVWEYAGLH